MTPVEEAAFALIEAKATMQDAYNTPAFRGAVEAWKRAGADLDAAVRAARLKSTAAGKSA